jgi:hypothetical protein
VTHNRRVTVAPLTPVAHWTSIVVVWVLTAVGAVLVGVFTNSTDYLGWLGVVMAASILVSACVQLATQQKDGFVMRLGACATGSFALLAVTTGVLALVYA